VYEKRALCKGEIQPIVRISRKYKGWKRARKGKTNKYKIN